MVLPGSIGCGDVSARRATAACRDLMREAVEGRRSEAAGSVSRLSMPINTHECLNGTSQRWRDRTSEGVNPSLTIWAEPCPAGPNSIRDRHPDQGERDADVPSRPPWGRLQLINDKSSQN